MTALLAVHDIEVSYGAINALHGISIDVEKGSPIQATDRRIVIER